jgi:membrane-associated protein
MFDALANAVSTSWWTYPLIVGVCAADALLPLFPSETIVVAAAVLAGNGELSIVAVVAAAAAGALLGDNAAYGVGRSALRGLADRHLRSERSRRRLEWGRGQLQSHGPAIIVVARFIPGRADGDDVRRGHGRHALAPALLPADAGAALLWALYASALGYFGGQAFTHNLWEPLLLATVVALLVTGAGEVLRRTVLDRDVR